MITEDVFSQVVMFEEISDNSIRICTIDGFTLALRLHAARFRNPYAIRHLFGVNLRWIKCEVLEEEDTFIGYICFSFEHGGKYKEVNLDFVGDEKEAVNENAEIEFFRTVWHPNKITIDD